MLSPKTKMRIGAVSTLGLADVSAVGLPCGVLHASDHRVSSFIIRYSVPWFDQSAPHFAVAASLALTGTCQRLLFHHFWGLSYV